MLTEALLCLAANVYHEARGEPYEGMVAVAEVTLRRAEQSGSDVCSVVYKPWQFSWTMTKLVDQHPSTFEQTAWARSLLAASEAYTAGYTVTTCADHYYSTTIPEPYWVRYGSEERTIGLHKFYCDVKNK